MSEIPMYPNDCQHHRDSERCYECLRAQLVEANARAEAYQIREELSAPAKERDEALKDKEFWRSLMAESSFACAAAIMRAEAAERVAEAARELLLVIGTACQNSRRALLAARLAEYDAARKGGG